MVQVLPNNQKPSFSSQVNSGINAAMPALQQFMDQKQQQNQILGQQKAVEKLGLDPSILNLPPSAQSEYFKNAFSQEKQLTPLQQSQKSLNEEKLSALKGKQKLFGQLFQGQENQQGQEPGQQGSNQQKMPKSQGQNQLQQMPEQNLQQLASFAGQPGEEGIIGNMAKSELDRRSKEMEKSESRYKMTRKEETELSKPILLSLNESRKNIPLQEQAIEDIISASSEVSPLDYFADLTGIEPLRTASGAKLKTALKDFFLSDLTRAGARPNQWIEMQLSDALPKMGRSVEANHIVAEGMKFKVDLAKKRIEIIDELAEKDRDKHGYVKGDIDSRASKAMKPYVEKRQKEMKNSIEMIKKNKILKGVPESKMIDVRGPDGQIYEIKASEIGDLPEGYIVE